MTPTVERNRAVYKETDNQYSETNLILLIEDGEPATWKCHGISWEYSLWPTIGERAGLAEVQDILIHHKDRGHLVTSMEKYIALYREEINKAQHFEEMFERFSLRARIHITGEGTASIKDTYDKEDIIAFMNSHNLSTEPAQPGTPPQELAITTMKEMNTAYHLSMRHSPENENNHDITMELIIEEMNAPTDATGNKETQE